MKSETKELAKILDTIEKYKDQGKLAAFVGAGVSSLSEYPSWRDLVIKMAEKIGYTISLKDSDNKPSPSFDEYMKIPQYMYNQSPKGYLRFIKKFFRDKKEPNEIHKYLLRLKPDHFLTTNYDTLIEQAANSAGMSYSVINSDKKVAVAPTRNYIIKVHGDFEKNNIVLKEDDYLDYENNFRLIDTLIKSIISTHLILFIGYGLGDYNIKLILNWVKQVQKDSFIEPIFIHTGKKRLTETEKNYYAKAHLRVLDANIFFDKNENPDYSDKYKRVMSVIVGINKEKTWETTNSRVINHFYSIFEPLKDVRYLRIDDIKSLFANSIIELGNIIKGTDFVPFIKAYEQKESLSPKVKNRLDYILSKIANSGIEVVCGVRTNENGVILHEKTNGNLCEQTVRGFRLYDDVFDASYQEIRERINLYEDDIDDQYCKAYDLFLLGRIDECKKTYEMLVEKCFTDKRWILYFFSQINLYYIRQTIFYYASRLDPFAMAISFKDPKTLWEKEKLMEMSLSHMISDAPSKIKKYKFVTRLLEKNCYTSDYSAMIADCFSVEKKNVKSQFVIEALSAEKRILIRLFDAINFVYGNRLVFSKFNEHKDFVKTNLREYYKGILKQNKLSVKYNTAQAGVTDEVGVQELVLMARTFQYDDLVVFYEMEEGKELRLPEEKVPEFEAYVCNIIDYFETFLTPVKRENVTEVLMLKEELKNALLLGSFYLKTADKIDKCINYINDINDDHKGYKFDDKEKQKICDRYRSLH